MVSGLKLQRKGEGGPCGRGPSVDEGEEGRDALGWAARGKKRERALAQTVMEEKERKRKGQRGWVGLEKEGRWVREKDFSPRRF